MIRRPTHRYWSGSRPVTSIRTVDERISGERSNVTCAGCRPTSSREGYEMPMTRYLAFSRSSDGKKGPPYQTLAPDGPEV